MYLDTKNIMKLFDKSTFLFISSGFLVVYTKKEIINIIPFFKNNSYTRISLRILDKVKMLEQHLS